MIVKIMSCNKRTFSTILIVISLEAISTLTVMFCSLSIFAQVATEEMTNLISIVPGASSPSNPEFFKPPNARVLVDTNVTWTNSDSTIHSVNSGIFNTADLGQDPFQSGVINQGGTFKHLFEESGSYDYYCSIHPFMTGKVTVEAATS